MSDFETFDDAVSAYRRTMNANLQLRTERDALATENDMLRDALARLVKAGTRVRDNYLMPYSEEPDFWGALDAAREAVKEANDAGK